MILRKPYAFFIKYFRLINLIMALLMAILIYHTFKIGKFISQYVSDYTVASSFVIGDYISIYSFLLALVIIIGTIIVLSVLFVKDKPKKLYLFNLILFFALIILYGVDYSVLRTVHETNLDIRVSKALRDFAYMALFLQVISFVLTTIRATGFDIKSFDFASDLQSLEIDTKDNEEFEVAVEFDKNKVKRNIRKNIRNVKYIYLEHKFLINLCVIIFVVILGFSIYMNKGIYSANYKEGENFSASSVVMNVSSSYITNTDFDGNKVTSDALVVVKFSVKKMYDSDKISLNTGLMNLRVNGKSYNQTSIYNDYLSDIGESYVDQKLSSDFVTYIVTFDIPYNSINNSMTLKFNDNISYVKGEMGAKSIYVKLSPVSLLENKGLKEYSINDKVNFKGSILEGSSLVITGAAISNKFKSEYSFCLRKDLCTPSYEYVTPTATGSYAKTLIKLEGDFEPSDNSDIDTLYDFINTFGEINYKVDGTVKKHKINSKIVKPKMKNENDVTYIEVSKELERASDVYFTFNVRDYSYKYVIK